MDLKELRLWVSPLTNEIYAGFEKDGVALKKINITDSAISCVMQHLGESNDYNSVECDKGTLRFDKKFQ